MTLDEVSTTIFQGLLQEKRTFLDLFSRMPEMPPGIASKIHPEIPSVTLPEFLSGISQRFFADIPSQILLMLFIHLQFSAKFSSGISLALPGISTDISSKTLQITHPMISAENSRGCCSKTLPEIRTAIHPEIS